MLPRADKFFRYGFTLYFLLATENTEGHREFL
jgi:hypothetical protein